MGRTIVRPVEQQRTRRSGDRWRMSVFAVMLVFAVLGLISAISFVADHVSASGATPTATSKHNGASGNKQAAAEVARAQAQSTALVRAARDASSSIIRKANNRAQIQANSIVAAARKRAAALPTAAPAPPASSGTQPSYTSSGTSNGYGSAYPTAVVAQTYPTLVPTVAPSAGSGAGSTPDLSSVPSSWMVVGYNATFGSGPGSAGGISVVNRSTHTFSGTATVRYANGQVATAAFSGLAPGQSAVLPLNGPTYPGGKYAISLTNLH